MNRGIDRGAIFSDPRSYEHLVALLAETVERFQFRVHAYCLMSNHYHALIQTPEANLSQGMQWLGVSYSSWFNARHDRVGPLFQGRFKSVPVQEGKWAVELSRYIHLNPVRVEALGLDKRKQRVASLGIGPPPTRDEVTARLKRLREYPWSSYRVYAGYRCAPEWLRTTEILKQCTVGAGDKPHRAYREQVQRMVREEVDGSKLEQIRDAVAIGSADFVAQIKATVGGGSRETERRRRLKRRVAFEDVVQGVEGYRDQPRGEWLDRHGDWGKWMVLRVARAYTGMTLAELGEAIGGKDYAAVSTGLRVFERKLKADRNLNKAYREIVQNLNI
jgi:REP element-mobilizing transposase RayT